MEPSAAAFAAHAFEYDSNTLDKELVTFIQRFYTFSDDRENAHCWAAQFAEDGVMKKATTNVTGRKEIAKANQNSWVGQASRQHVVQKVFPFSSGQTDEVMLWGVSKYVYETGETGEMTWAAHLQFKRDESGILIDTYHIFPTPLVKKP